jgi:hypothetical protein
MQAWWTQWLQRASVLHGAALLSRQLVDSTDCAGVLGFFYPKIDSMSLIGMKVVQGHHAACQTISRLTLVDSD